MKSAPSSEIKRLFDLYRHNVAETKRQCRFVDDGAQVAGFEGFGDKVKSTFGQSLLRNFDGRITVNYDHPAMIAALQSTLKNLDAVDIFHADICYHDVKILVFEPIYRYF
jgi:hypothetical protein